MTLRVRWPPIRRWVADRVRQLRVGERWHQRLAGSAILGGGAGILAFAVLSNFPKTYESDANLLVVGSKASGASGLVQLAASQLGISPQSADLVTPQLVLVALGTDAILDSVLRSPHRTSTARYATLGAYLVGDSAEFQRHPAKPRKRLLHWIDATVDIRAPVVTLRAWDHDSVGAADLANTVTGVLNQYLVHYRVTNSKEQREYLERELQKSKDSLTAAEDAVIRFLIANRSVTNSPILDFELTRLRRRADHASDLEANVTQQLRAARLDEARDTPAAIVIDAPLVPEAPSGPRVKLISALVLLLVGAGSLFFLPLWRQLVGPDL